MTNKFSFVLLIYIFIGLNMRLLNKMAINLALILFLIIGCKQHPITSNIVSIPNNGNHNYKYICISSSMLELDKNIEKYILKNLIKLQVDNENGKLIFQGLSMNKTIAYQKDEVISGYNIYNKTFSRIMQIDSSTCLIIYIIYISHDKNFRLIENENGVNVSGGSIDGSIYHALYITLDGNENFSVQDLKKDYDWSELKIKENSYMVPNFLDNVIDNSQYRVKYDYYLE